MESQQPRNRRPSREGTASPTRIIATLGGILVGVALLGWAVLAFAGALVPPATPSPATSVAAVAKVTTSTPAVQASSADTSQTTTVAAPKVTAPPPAAPKIVRKPAPKPKVVAAPPAQTQFVVVIDPGHQLNGNNSPEPIGPGSSQTKPAVAGGATGVSSGHRAESQDNLEISLKIRDALVAQGVKVIMVRTKQNVNITNKQRAMIANDNHANLFLRVHCDSGPSNVTGFLTLVPGPNRWTGPILSSSARAGRDVQAAAVAATGAHNRGVTPRGDLSGFNWSTVPTVLVECGMMSNVGEDTKLRTPAYQAKLAAGISAGIMRFLHGK